RGDDNGAFGIELLIGSDPHRAPRQINRWGYIAEDVQGADAHVLGLMKRSEEQSIAEAESRLAKESSAGGYFYPAIEGTSTAKEARAAVTTLRVERDLTYRDIDSLLALVGGPEATAADATLRAVALPPGTRSGFLVALQDLVKQSTDAYARGGSSGF